MDRCGQNTLYRCMEQGQQQQTWQTQQGKAQEASTQPKELQAMKDAESRRNNLPQGRAHQQVIQY